MLIRNLYYLYGNSESSNARLDSAIPNAIEEIKTAPVLHTLVCNKEDMKQVVVDFLAM
jgi:hypothetical protein